MTHAQAGRHALPEPDDEHSPAVPESEVDDAPPAAAPGTHPDTLAPAEIKRTRVAVIIALLVLVLLLIFILQNLATATVLFLGMSGSMPLAVAMLFAAIAGGLLVGLVGWALQLRKEAKKARKASADVR